MKKIKLYISRLWWRIKDVFLSIKAWFCNCFNKKHFSVVKTAFIGYPWDHCYLYDLEYAKLEEMEAYFEKSNITTIETYANMLKYIRIAKYCLNVMRDKVDTFTYEYPGKLEFKQCDSDDNLYECINSDELFKTYKCLVNVNTNNISRFFNNLDESDINYIKQYPHELYIKKAKYLYYKIRYEQDHKWWD